ncbi:MAG: efflux RND transporter periplasmic adaptor subunit [Parvibaculales bacterium]
MLKYFDFLNRFPFYRALPDQGKLAVVLALLVSLWSLSGFLIPSGPALELPETVSERNKMANRLIVRTEVFKPFSQAEIIVVRGATEADRTVQLVAQTPGTIKALPFLKGAFVKTGQVVCQLDVDARQARLEEAEALMRAREIDYKAAQKLVEKGHFSISRAAAAKAAYDTAVALHKQSRVELERTRIKAPFDGIYDDQPLEVGDFISLGQSCGTIVNKDPLIVVAQVSETQISALEPGGPARVKLVTGETVEGTLTYVASQADRRTRTFKIEVMVPNKDNLLRDGVSAEVTLTGKQREAYLIPHSIISLSTDGVVGVNVVQNNIVEFTPVTILSDDLSGLFVVGLVGEAEIITVGQNFVKDGQRVEVSRSAQPQIKKTKVAKPQD